MTTKKKAPKICTKCKGTGTITQPQWSQPDSNEEGLATEVGFLSLKTTPCPNCQGTGKIISAKSSKN